MLKRSKIGAILGLLKIISGELSTESNGMTDEIVKSSAKDEPIISAKQIKNLSL